MTTTDAIRVGLIGHGIQLSRTPAMHMEEGRAQALDYRYELYDVAAMEGVPSISDLLDRAQADGCAGVNVTHPFKQAVLPHLDEVSDSARAVGAANTVVFRAGKRHGHNSDYSGFAEGFRRALPDAKRDRVVLLGCGGAGGAVANALLDESVGHLVLSDRDAGAAADLAMSLSARLGPDRVSVAADTRSALDGADGVVNATPVGMASHPGCPVPESFLQPPLWVGDIIYFPLETELLATARARGCATLDGSGMAVFQAVRAFELFTGRKADPDRMRATFDSFDR